jgi:hypothetical protein
MTPGRGTPFMTPGRGTPFMTPGRGTGGIGVGVAWRVTNEAYRMMRRGLRDKPREVEYCWSMQFRLRPALLDQHFGCASTEVYAAA